MAEMPQFSVFTTIFYYSIFILLAPIATFFTVKIVLFEGKLHCLFNKILLIYFAGLFNTFGVSANVWSAIAAVMVLHIALGLYIYKAYSSAEKVKDDKTD